MSERPDLTNLFANASTRETFQKLYPTQVSLVAVQSASHSHAVVTALVALDMMYV